MELLAQSSPGPARADDEQPDFDQVYDQLRQAIGRAMVRQLLQQFIALYPDLLRWQDKGMAMLRLVTIAARKGAVGALGILLKHY
jgi:hypothetical protein